jgi:hypothetical protein
LEDHKDQDVHHHLKTALHNKDLHKIVHHQDSKDHHNLNVPREDLFHNKTDFHQGIIHLQAITKDLDRHN